MFPEPEQGLCVEVSEDGSRVLMACSQNLAPQDSGHSRVAL